MGSFVCVIVLTVFAAIVTFVPDLTVTERLASAGVILFSGVAAVILLRRERHAEQTEKATTDKQVKGLSQDVAIVLTAVRDLQSRLPAGSPERKTFEQAFGSILLNYPAMFGSGEVIPPPNPDA
jgi:hypothetical protein